MILTAKRLRELLEYQPDTGLFVWLCRTGGTGKAGAIAGTIDSFGYVRIGIDGRVYRAHRLAVFYMNGAWPINEVDHCDGDKANNRWENLRDVPRITNQQNQRKPHRRGSSGFLGVSLHEETGRWRSRIWVNGRNVSLGLHDTPNEAHAAYVLAKREIHEGNTL